MISKMNQCKVGDESSAHTKDVAHVMRALQSAAARPSPFAHTLVENLLPEDLFMALREEARRGHGPEWEGDESRSAFFFTQSIGEPHGLTEAGRRTVATLTARPVVEAACRIFEIESISKNLCVGLELMKDGPGFMLPPHTDGSRRVLGALIYLADPDDPQTLGTRLYTPKDAELTSNGGAALWYDRFDEAGAAPYRGNAALIWARSDQSFHGVPIGLVDRERRALQWSIESIG